MAHQVRIISILSLCFIQHVVPKVTSTSTSTNFKESEEQATSHCVIQMLMIMGEIQRLFFTVCSWSFYHDDFDSSYNTFVVPSFFLRAATYTALPSVYLRLERAHPPHNE